MSYSNHPSWRAHFINQQQFPTGNVNHWDRNSHDMAMIKDLLVTIMNLMDQQKAILEEHADMLDLLMAHLIDEE
jgi:hypothetical protein